MEDQGSQPDAGDLEPQHDVYQPQPGERFDKSFQANGWSDLFDWDTYEKDANQEHVGDNTNFPVGNSDQVRVDVHIFGPEREVVANERQRKGLQHVHTQHQQRTSPNRRPSPGPEPVVQFQHGPGTICPSKHVCVTGHGSEITESVINSWLRARQDNGSAAAVMRARVSSPPISFGVDNSPAQANNSLPLEGVMSSPAASYKLFPTAGLTNPVESSPEFQVDTPSKAGRKKKSGGQTKSPSKQSPLKKPLLKKIVFRKRKATSSPHNQAYSLVQPNDNDGTGNLSVQDNRSAMAGLAMNPLGLLDPLSDLPEELLPPSANNSPVPTPPPGPHERRDRLKNTLAEYHVDRMTAWKALPGFQRIKFFKELVRADDRGEELEHWELDFLTYSTEEDRTIVYREIALEAEKKVEALEERHNRLRQKFEDSKQSEHQLRKWNFALKRAVEKNELERKKMESRIAGLERSHLVLNQGLDERVHLLNLKVDRKVKELEEAIAKLSVGE